MESLSQPELRKYKNALLKASKSFFFNKNKD